jgi:TusA-related sulfurtransferase
MEITTDNFSQQLEDIKRAIKECDFIAMDTEFPGLDYGKKAQRNHFDGSNILYQKQKFLWEKFQAIQVGLCIFIWDKKKSIYYSRPYNFYVMPDSELEGENTAMCFEPKTWEFLQKHFFDWDSFFKSSISYKTKERRDEIMEKWEKLIRNEYSSTHKGSFISVKGQRNIKDYLKQIQNFCFDRSKLKMSIKEQSKLVRIELKKRAFKQLNVKGYLEVTSDKDNPNVIIFSKKEWFDHDNFCYIDTNDEEEASAEWNVHNSKSYEEAKKQTEEIKRMKEYERERKKKALFLKEYGFTAIVEKIIKYKKPLIGHNWFFDILYFYRQFVGELPDSIAEFKELWRSNFPFTFDTKHISWKIAHFPQTSLGAVFKSWIEGKKFKDMAIIRFQAGFDKYKKETKCHEAGYDAYMTGYVFAILWKYQEIQIQYDEHRKEYEGVQFRKDDENTDDSGDEQVYNDIKKQSKKAKWNIGVLESLNLKIAKSLTGGAFYYLGEKEQEEESGTAEDKSAEAAFDKENSLWVEIDDASEFQQIEEFIKKFGKITVQEKNDKGIIVEFNQWDKEKFETVGSIMNELNDTEEFHGTAHKYQTYLDGIEDRED